MRNNEFRGVPGLQPHPPVEQWDHWVELDPRAWPRRVEKHYTLVPTACANCEASCGLVAFVDQESGQIRKLEPHPLHPASRGRNCARGPATLAQVTNPDRILYPLRRAGARGEGRWQRVGWDEALADIAGRIRRAITAGRRDGVVCHVGHAGEDLFTERVMQCWGMDGYNSRTNVCSAAARTGYAFWMGHDRPVPDLSHAHFILLLSAHPAPGHHPDSHAQHIAAAGPAGCQVAVVDPRRADAAERADFWLAPRPGTEAGLLLAMANLVLQSGRIDRDFIRRWVNWRQFLADRAYLGRLQAEGWIETLPVADSFTGFLTCLGELYSHYTPEWAAAETGVPARDLRAVAAAIGRAGKHFAGYIWRGAAAAHRGGWMMARCLMLLQVLTGSVGTRGGLLPGAWTKFVPSPPSRPAPVKVWNEKHWPPEYPLAAGELSFLLPHLLRAGRGQIDVYFTRAYNPVWANPDGCSWIEMLTDTAKIGLHVALTPTWNESAQYADYVLPMGLGPERHDLHSAETHAAQWIGFRQPVLRAYHEAQGRQVERTCETNPGAVWEENEFWIELSWRIDPDGGLGVRQHFESPYRPQAQITVGEYYRHIFENSVPGLPEAARQAGLRPLAYMRRRGAFAVATDVYNQHEAPVPRDVAAAATVDPETGLAYGTRLPRLVNFRPEPAPVRNGRGETRIGVQSEVGAIVQGWPTPSGRLEFFSTTLRDWGWPEYAIPVYPRSAAERKRMVHITSQVHPDELDAEHNECALLPNFRPSPLTDARTSGAPWLHELSRTEDSHPYPVWIHPREAARVGVGTGDLVKVETEIGCFVDRCWVTEAIPPGVVAGSPHLGHWRLHADPGGGGGPAARVSLERQDGRWRLQQLARQPQSAGVQPCPSGDADAGRGGWRVGGAPQNLAFPAQPDPISGQHCWHQKVRLSRAGPGDAPGSASVDTARADAVYRRWLQLCRPAQPGGMRRPLWLLRPLRPHPDAWRL